MKNLSTRSKRLLAIAAIVIVVVVVGLVILVPGQEGLFGTTGIHISPENPTIVVGQNITLTINSVFACKWSSSVAGVVTIVSSADKSVTLKGAADGTTTIKADCGTNHYTNVTVKRPTPTPTATATSTPTRTPTPTPLPLSISPANPFISVGSDPIILTAANAVGQCRWTGHELFSYYWTGPCGNEGHCSKVQPYARDHGWTSATGNVVFPMSVTCANGTASTRLTWGVQYP